MNLLTDLRTLGDRFYEISSCGGDGKKNLTRVEFLEEFNARYLAGETFFFLIDHDLRNFDISTYGNWEEDGIFFTLPPRDAWIDLVPHYPRHDFPSKSVLFEKFPIPFPEYTEQFRRVMAEIHKGNTYLLNLTTETPIRMNLTLGEIFALSCHHDHTPYRLWYRDRFISFSPETFIKVTGDRIDAFPMKGTYDDREKAEVACRRGNPKERWEQTTVVDRVRNDLSRICSRVGVDGFLCLQEVETHRGKLYQTLSQVTGKLGENFFRDPAGSLLELLPAASVTGAPQESTTALIHEIESHHRNFYTGVWGVCHQGNIESSIIIRYLEKRGDGYYYKSGGGITFMSTAEAEYREMVDKIYLPFPLGSVHGSF